MKMMEAIPQPEHINGSAYHEPQDAVPVYSADEILEQVHSLAADASQTDRLQLYRLLKPSLVDLYEQDEAEFHMIAKEIAPILHTTVEALRTTAKALILPSDDEDSPLPSKGVNQATLLVRLGEQESVTLWRADEEDTWATIVIDGHEEHWPLREKGFRRYLERCFYTTHGTTPGSQAVQEALGTLAGKARYDNPDAIFSVFTRVAECEECIYLDLANERWEVVEITEDGWRIIQNPPVRFRRNRNMWALPQPERGGKISLLRPFLNLPPDEEEGPADDWVLTVEWLVAALRPRGPYPILTISGEQGSAKSTFARVLRMLIDPAKAAIRSKPREERDLMASAVRAHILAFDNLSRISQELSDSLCRLATGGGVGGRSLYTNDEEHVLEAVKPLILTGIPDLGESADFLDRTIPLVLPPIGKEERRTEKQFWQDFEQARPFILGALLDAVSVALRTLPQINLKELPRMADFALWGTAAESGFGWEPDTFLSAYQRKISSSTELALSAAIISEPLLLFINHLPWEPTPEGEAKQWQGTCKELLEQLELQAEDKTLRDKFWPKSLGWFSNLLRRIATPLRRIRVDIAFLTNVGPNKERAIRITERKNEEEESPQASSPGGTYTKEY